MEIPGIIHREDLAALSIDRRDRDRWRRTGAIESIQPWYVTPEAPRDVVALLRLGVRPTCLDGAALHGLWVPPGREAVHVYAPRRGRGRRSAATAEFPGAALAAPIRHRGGGKARPLELPLPLRFHAPSLRSWPDRDPVPEIALVLAHAGRCLSRVDAAILFESALNRRLLTLSRARQIIAELPGNARRDLARVRADAQSGSETFVRWWWESLGVPVRSQVHVPGVGFVDMLIGRSWVIECDGRQYHDTDEQFHRDRERDLVLRSLGLTVTRLSWQQIFLRWSRTRQLLLDVSRRGDHRRPAAGLERL